MRAALLALGIGLFFLPAAEAHSRHAHSQAVVTVSWTWVPGHWVRVNVRQPGPKWRWVQGYWVHPRHGKSFRAYRAGPPRHRHR